MARDDQQVQKKSNLLDTFTHIVKKRKLSADELRTNLQDTDPALLLMSLVHITRDYGLLDRFGPYLQRGDKGELLPGVKMVDTIAGVSTAAAVPPEVRAEMIEIAVAALDKDPKDQADYITGYELDREALRA